MQQPYHILTMVETLRNLASGEIKAFDLVSAFLERIERFNPVLHAYITVAAEQALRAAEEVDRRAKVGETQGPLAGIPLGVKDLIPTKSIRTTCNSRLLENWVPDKDAAPIARLRQSGAIILGKTNTNEFGWSVPSDDDLAPIPRNPWNLARAAIGSSSGSGAGLSAGLCSAAIGTDGGGSTRLPAAQMGLVGIKPTHGRVSRLNMDNSPISEISPMGHTVEDTALMLEIMAGYEPEDHQSMNLPVPSYSRNLQTDLRGWKIGVPRRYIETTQVESEILKAFEEAVLLLRDLGARVENVDVHGLAEARMANFLILNAYEHAEHHLSLQNHPEKYGRSAYLYMLSGGILSAADYINALGIAGRVRQYLQELFKDYRALILPTQVFITSEAARQPGVHHNGMGAAFTSPFNATGHPAISIPCGRSEQVGFPIGFEIVAGLFEESTLFQIAHAFEQASGWYKMAPNLS
jgi:aspartyl-tRNA(Asn)/glutamyl-tRNA(Gln) amidotransferase subunit A